MQYLIGSDVGTSGTKTVLFDETGKIVETAFREYPLYQTKSGWAEQDPRDWAEAVLATVREVLEKSGIAPDKVKGVGLSGQMHGLVLLDKACRVLRKSIIWCDQRTQAECDEITEIVGKERLTEITANPAITGFTASKIRWVQKNEPEIWAKTAHILLPKDYVRFVLTGEFITDVSDASGMQLMDIAGRCYSDEVLEKLHIERRFLPRIVESAECGGRVCAAAAAVCGLKEGTAVAGSAGDQAAAAIGNGIVESGIVSCNIGTSGVVFAHTETPRADAKGRVHTFCHAVRGKWHVMGVTQGAGLSMKWFKDHFYAERAKETDDIYAIVNADIASVPVGCEGLLYLPYLMGERTPHLDADAKGVFFGITPRHTRAHFARAVMEGVSFSLLDCLQILQEMGNSPREIRIGGGGAKSALWKQMIADVFGCETVATNSGEAGALGAAILAGVAAGVYQNVETACRNMIRITERFSPDPEKTREYRKFYRIYCGLYPALKNNFKELQELC